MNCPFCQQELKEIYCNGICLGLMCKNKDCLETKSTLGNKALWQELITTRKALDELQKDYDSAIKNAKTWGKACAKYKSALDVTVDALKDTNGYLYGDYVNTKWDLHEIIRKTLEQINEITKGGDNE